VSNRPALCLNLIVKNEAAIIGRLIDSVSPYIDYYVVCDTGSTDDTVTRIREEFAKRGVAGEVYSIPFVNFSQARNEALARGRVCTGAFQYFLFADADMELVVKDEGFTARLEAPAYIVRQRGGPLSYYNVRLLRRDAPAVYVGATHEYLDVSGRERLSEIEFLDHACGSNRVDKAVRDIRLLTTALRENPDDVRAMFYLAQTYRETGRYEEAALWYEARTQAGGFGEEVWYARYQLALCCARLDDPPGFVDECLRAYEERPWRAEPLHALASYYWKIGAGELAQQYEDACGGISYPGDDILFVEEDIYGDCTVSPSLADPNAI
jgi:glycosyltransferase involved in cell wall biosynthesis